MSNLSMWARQQIMAQNETSFAKRKYAKMVEKSMAPHIPQNSTLSDSYKTGYERNKTMLSIVVLLYLYGSDDGIITNKEKRIFSKVFNSNKKLLNREDYQELLNHTVHILSLDNVLEYIEMKKYSSDLVNESVSLIKKYSSKDYNYIKALNELIEKYEEMIS